LRTEEAAQIEVVKREKGWTRMVLDEGASIVYGWIPSGLVLEHEQELGVLGGVMGGIGGIGLSGVGTGPAPRRCASDLRLWTRQRGKLGPEVGLLAASTPFFARTIDPLWSAITLPEVSWLEMMAGNELVVAAGDLVGCESRPLDR